MVTEMRTFKHAAFLHVLKTNLFFVGGWRGLICGTLWYVRAYVCMCVCLCAYVHHVQYMCACVPVLFVHVPICTCMYCICMSCYFMLSCGYV